MHVHVASPEGNAKFWLEPIVALNRNYGISPRKIKEIQKVIEDKKDEIIRDWKEHFAS